MILGYVYTFFNYSYSDLKKIEDVLLEKDQNVTADCLELIKSKLKELFPDQQFNPQEIVDLVESDDDDELKGNTVIISDSDEERELDKEVEEILRHTSSIKIEDEINNEIQKNLFPKPTEGSPKKIVKFPSKEATTPKRPKHPMESIASYRLKKTIMPPSSAYVKPSARKQVNYLTVPYKESQLSQRHMTDQNELEQKLENFKEKFFARRCVEVKKVIQMENTTELASCNDKKIKVVKAAPIKSFKKMRRSSCAESSAPTNSEAKDTLVSRFNLRSRSKSMFPAAAQNITITNTKQFHHMIKDIEKNQPLVKVERLQMQIINYRTTELLDDAKMERSRVSKRRDDLDMDESFELLDVLHTKKKFKVCK